MKKYFSLILCVLIAACSVKQESEEQKGVTFQKVSFSDLNGFNEDDFASFEKAYTSTCAAIAKSSSLMQASAVKMDKNAYLKACRRFEKLKTKDKETLRAFFKSNFTPYAVLSNGSPEGKFTAYYEAEIRASKTKHGPYQYPIYGKPNDLVELNLKDFGADLPNKRILGRVSDGKLKPYFTRAEIETNGVDAPVILWGDDKVDIFLMQIQGSAVALLDDGTSVRVSYADNNGHAFVGIGSLLLKKGLLKKGEASMDKIRDWLKNNPQLANNNMMENPRFIFHQISNASGPIGALGVPLTAGRSLAVDQNFIALGTPLWLDTTDPSGKPLQKAVMAQDIGAAITGPIRGDYFWGHGEEALLQAGKMNASGKFYVLMPND